MVMIERACPVDRPIICSVCKRVKNRSTALGDIPQAVANWVLETQSWPRSRVIIVPPALNFVGLQHAVATNQNHAPKR